MYTYNESGNEKSGKWDDEYEIGCVGYENLATWYEIPCSGYEMLVLGMKWKHSMKQKKIHKVWNFYRRYEKKFKDMKKNLGYEIFFEGMKKVIQKVWNFCIRVWKKFLRYEKKFKSMKKTF